MVLTPLVVYGFVVFAGVPLANHFLGQAFDELTKSSSGIKVIDAQTAPLLGVLLAAAATVCVVRHAWGSRSTTEAWRKGAEGERLTEDSLAGIAEEGYVLLHDRRIPGGQANIDHVVIGPTGVYIVETKHYSGRVVISRGAVLYNGRSMDRAVDQSWREAAAVEAALGERLRDLGVRVRPIVCIQGADLELEGWRVKPIVRGARFCSGRRLRHVISEGDRVLEARDIEILARRLDAELPPAMLASAPVRGTVVPDGAPDCACGALMVLRHRRSDGSRFWGCGRFPECRSTRPIPRP